MKLGDGEKLSVEGSGSLKIRMHDRMVRKLDAWYVPGLRRNLISVGALSKHGYVSQEKVEEFGCARDLQL